MPLPSEQHQNTTSEYTPCKTDTRRGMIKHMLGCWDKVPPDRSLFNMSDYIIQQILNLKSKISGIATPIRHWYCASIYYISKPTRPDKLAVLPCSKSCDKVSAPAQWASLLLSLSKLITSGMAVLIQGRNLITIFMGKARPHKNYLSHLSHLVPRVLTKQLHQPDKLSCHCSRVNWRCQLKIKIQL